MMSPDTKEVFSSEYDIENFQKMLEKQDPILIKNEWRICEVFRFLEVLILNRSVTLTLLSNYQILMKILSTNFLLILSKIWQYKNFIPYKVIYKSFLIEYFGEYYLKFKKLCQNINQVFYFK